MLNRLGLIEKLECIAPAFANNPLVPILTHAWFTGERLVAYNDLIGMSVPLKTPFKGAVPGALLLNLMKVSRGDKDGNVELVQDGTNLLLKGSGQRTKLPVLPPADFCFTMPKLDKPNVADFSKPLKTFLGALEMCLRSVTNDTTHPDQLGVTLIPKGPSVLMFATDTMTITHAKTPYVGFPTGQQEGRAVLPTLFCKQALALARNAKTATLEVHKDHVLFAADTALLFGRLVELGHAEPFGFEQVFSRHMEPTNKQPPIKVPSRVRLIFERATIMTDSKIEKGRTRIKSDKGLVTFNSVSDVGEANDNLRIDNHPDVSLTVDPKIVRTGAADFDRMLFTTNCVIMQNDVATFLVSASGNK